MVLVAKLIYAICFCFFLYILFFTKRAGRFEEVCVSLRDMQGAVALVCVHLAIIFVLFGVLDLPPQGDLGGYYLPQAILVGEGKAPWRDFESSYGAAFPYVVWAFSGGGRLAGIWSSAVLFLFAVGAYYTRTRFFASMSCGQATKYWLVLAANPITLWFVTAVGTNNVLISGALVLAGTIVVRGLSSWRPWLRAAVVGSIVTAAVAVTKLIALVPVIGLARAKDGIRIGLASFTGILLYAFATKWILGVGPLEALTREVGYWTPSNLWYVSGILGYTTSLTFFHGVCVLALVVWAGSCLWKAYGDERSVDGQQIAAAICGAFFIFQLLSPKSYTSYASMILPILTGWVLSMHSKKALVAYAAYSAAASLEMSLWKRVLSDGPITSVGEVEPIWGVVFVCTQIAIVGGAAWLLLLAGSQLYRGERAERTRQKTVGHED